MLKNLFKGNLFTPYLNNCTKLIKVLPLLKYSETALFMISTDFIIYNKKHQLTLTVEVKKLVGMSEKWATEYRRNLVSQGTYPIAPYFLLATPDRFFLWHKDNNRLDLTKPTCTFNSEKYLRPFFEDFGTTYNKASSFILEMAVARWLKNLIYETDRHKIPLPKCIKEIGLDKAIFEGIFYM